MEGIIVDGEWGGTRPGKKRGEKIMLAVGGKVVESAKKRRRWIFVYRHGIRMVTIVR